MSEEDVPLRVDFRDPVTARTWVEDTRVQRPYRPREAADLSSTSTSTNTLTRAGGG